MLNEFLDKFITFDYDGISYFAGIPSRTFDKKNNRNEITNEKINHHKDKEYNLMNSKMLKVEGKKTLCHCLFGLA